MISLKDLMVIFITTHNLIVERMGLNSQMNYIIIYQEELRGKPFLELDCLKDGIN